MPILLVLLCLLALMPPSAAGAAAEKAAVSPDALAGENLTYDVAFLWFDRLAEARLTFEAAEDPGTYRAVLEARTLGVASWLTRNRVQRYVTVMETGPDEKLRPLSHEAHVIKGEGKKREDRIKRYLFDYERSEVLYQRVREGKADRDKSIAIDRKAPPADILTAFYNLRTGVYGPVEPGTRIVIPTFSHKKVSDIVVEALPDSRRRDLPFFPRDGTLLQVTVDPEVFDTGGGNVYVWFNEAGRPARGIVEDVIGMGNVRGTLH